MMQVSNVMMGATRYYIVFFFAFLSIISFNRSVCSVGLLSDQEVILPI